MAADQARDFASIALAYAKEAVADRKGRKFCKWVRLAAKRHLDDLKRETWPYEFVEWHANDVCDFIEKLPHVEGVWEEPTIRLEPPQIFILAVIFGWRRKEDGLRRFSNVYIEMARKGAKSTMTAGVALYCLCCEGEVGPQIIIGATTGDQAGKVFNPAKEMVRRTGDLREAFGLDAWSRSITCRDNGGFIQPINAKGKTQDGWNPHVGILDELHAHPNRALYDVIRSAFGSRRNPLMWIITTAGYNLAGVCYDQRRMVTKILEGVFEAEHYFGIIFSLDSADDYGDGRKDGDDPFDPRTWIKANPMLGITPTLASMETYAAEAKNSPDSEGEFKTKRLNLWLNAAGAWLNMAQWAACTDQTLDWADFEGLDCWIGGDLSDKDDITALVLAAYDVNGDLIIKPMFYLPEAVLSRADFADGRAVAPYRAWRDQGFMTLTPGDWIDQRVVEAQIVEWIERFSVRRVTFDSFSAAQVMASRLNEDVDPQIAAIMPKNAKNCTDAAKDVEARVKAARLRHDGNPILTWMASNAVVSRRIDGSILPKKEHENSPMKIDGIDALIDAIAPAQVPAPPAEFVEERVSIL